MANQSRAGRGVQTPRRPVGRNWRRLASAAASLRPPLAGTPPALWSTLEMVWTIFHPFAVRR